MMTTILDRSECGTCDLTGKKETEVFVIQAGTNGQRLAVCTGRLIELLRWNCAIDHSVPAGEPTGQSASTLPPK